jgi:uncharacterized protein YjiS (DUF1127 family)
MTTLSNKCTHSVGQNVHHTQNGLYDMLAQWFETQALKIAVKQERQQLLSLSDTMLKDLGITREAAVIESARQDLPINRRSKC